VTRHLTLIPGGKPADEPYDHTDPADSDLAQKLWRSKWLCIRKMYR
jgi:hypothetical protein